MHYSLKQLDQCYQNVCQNIQDAKEYTLQHLNTTFEIDIQAYYDNLGTTNLGDLENGLDKIEETVQQCRIAIRNEKSRRLLLDEIWRMTEKDSAKTMKKNDFKLKSRLLKLQRATPYQSPSQQSLGE